MEARSLRYVAASCDGEVSGAGDTVVRRVCTDSRHVQPGDLFVAVTGDKFDGHDFLAVAAQAGAVAAVVAHGRVNHAFAPEVTVRVADTRRAFGQLAARYRQDFELPVIAVGGSNGKTTTKELLAAVLRRKFPTLASEASFNNDIGVPVTLLQLERSHGAAVLEVGTNHPGELAPLVRLVQPCCGVLTSIGREHLEFFGDLDGVIAEEGWLAELLPAGGALFLNGDAPGGEAIARRSRATVVRAGLGAVNDWRATAVRMDGQGTDFELTSPRAELNGSYRVNLLGRHQVGNALLAVAVGAELGLGREELRQGLADCRPPDRRMQSWVTNGVRVLDDSYNANADSMRAALETLAALPGAGRRVAVLGDMAELGAHAAAAHVEAGRHAAELGVDALFAVGAFAAVLAGAARAAGLREVFEFAAVEPAAPAVKEFVRAGDTVLVKASRAARLERVVEPWRSPGAAVN